MDVQSEQVKLIKLLKVITLLKDQSPHRLGYEFIIVIVYVIVQKNISQLIFQNFIPMLAEIQLTIIKAKQLHKTSTPKQLRKPFSCFMFFNVFSTFPPGEETRLLKFSGSSVLNV